MPMGGGAQRASTCGRASSVAKQSQQLRCTEDLTSRGVCSATASHDGFRRVSVRRRLGCGLHAEVPMCDSLCNPSYAAQPPWPLLATARGMYDTDVAAAPAPLPQP